MTKKHLLLLTLVCLPSCNAQALLPSTFKEFTWAALATGGLAGFAYNWLQRKTLQKEYDTHKKRLKNHEFLTDCYEDALKALADHKEYVEIIEQNMSARESASQLSDHLIGQYRHTSNLLPTFKTSVRERMLGLEQHRKEIERSLIDWQESRKKALLAQQGPLLKNTYTLILSTLQSLSINIPYTEGYFFMQEHTDLLKEEHELETNLDTEQLTQQLDNVIRSKTKVGERYPYRSYAQWLEEYHEHVRLLKHELEQYTYFEFQQPVIDYIIATYEVIDALKRRIKSTKAFKAECIQYDAEMRVQSRTAENHHVTAQAG